MDPFTRVPGFVVNREEKCTDAVDVTVDAHPSTLTVVFARSLARPFFCDRWVEAIFSGPRSPLRAAVCLRGTPLRPLQTTELTSTNELRGLLWGLHESMQPLEDHKDGSSGTSADTLAATLTPPGMIRTAPATNRSAAIIATRN